MRKKRTTGTVVVGAGLRNDLTHGRRKAGKVGRDLQRE